MHSMIRKSALAATIAALLNPVVAGALGLGNIEVSSALHEPLNARIPLRGVSPEELDEIKAALGSDDQFLRAGLNREFILSSLRFKVIAEGGAGGHIAVTSHEPIAEPFLNFLVDVNWAKGRVVREYTVLLDPPVYGAAIRNATKRAVRTVDSLPKAAPKSAAVTKAAPPNYSASSAPRLAPRVATSSNASGVNGDSYGPVGRGETLWSIADKVRPREASIQSMMLALLRNNPQAFSLGNVNALKTGAVLRIPTASEVRDDKAQALAEVARQHGLWDEYRQSSSASVQAQPGGAAVASAKVPKPTGGSESSTAQDDKAASGADNAVLKLVGSGTTGSTAGGSSGAAADVQVLRDDLSLAQEEAEAAKFENQELNSRLDELRGIVDNMKRLVELREDQLAELQKKLIEDERVQQAAKVVEAAPAEPTLTVKPPPTAQPAVVVEPVPTSKVEKTPVAPVVTPKPPVAPPAPEPASFVDEIQSLLDDVQKMLPVPLWTILAGLGTLLLGFGGIRMARSRKDAAASEDETTAPSIDAGGSLIDQYAQTEMPRADDGDDDDATQMPARPLAGAETEIDDDKTLLAMPASSEPGSGTADEDPLAEVNVYLAYERFEQAEQLVRDAIETYPTRSEYRLKLLEVFYASKNVASFESSAEQLQATVGAESELMGQAHTWWDELGTGRALFAENNGPDTADNSAVADDSADDDLFDVTSAPSDAQTGVDFDLGFEDTPGEESYASGDLDFDLGAVDDSAGAVADGSLDFDLGGFADAGSATDDGAAAPQAVAAADSSLDFDLGGFADADSATDDGAPATPAIAAVALVGAGAAVLSTGVDFDLGDFGDNTSSDEQHIAGGAAESVDTGLDFDLDAGDGSGSEASADADSSTDDDALDFDLGGFDDGDQPAALVAATSADDSLDFDLDDGVDLSSGAGSVSGDLLDFDLGDTATLPKANPSEANANDADLDQQLDLDGDEDDFSLALDMDANGDDSGAELDFDFDATGTSDGEELDASSVDFDLGASDGEELDTSSVDFDLGDTGASDDNELDADGLDFDLGATGPSEGAELDTNSLDFDLSDADATDSGQGGQLAVDSAPVDFELDFELDDAAVVGATLDDSSTASELAVFGESNLDFDLGEIGAASNAGEASGLNDISLADDAAVDIGLDLDFELDADASDEAPLLLDMDLDATGENPAATVFHDALTEVSDGSALDLDLQHDSDDKPSAISKNDASDDDFGLPILDFDSDDGDDNEISFDTVQLEPEAAQILRESGGAAADDDFGMDTELRGIFAVGAEDDVGAGSSAALDFDLGTGLDDLDNVSEFDNLGADLDQTQFSLRDVPMASSNDDDDDHTLVLGRNGESGEVNEMQTKLDLAQAYMDMGDTEGARNLLGEVMADGADEQQQSAREMLSKLS
jgi:pilus assembly protein FimV